jgi:hypothetical protein
MTMSSYYQPLVIKSLIESGDHQAPQLLPRWLQSRAVKPPGRYDGR